MGGAEKVLLAVMQEVRRVRPDVQLHLLSLAAGPLVERAAALGAEVTVLPLPRGVESLGDSQLSVGGNRATRLFLILSQALRSSGEGWRYVKELRACMARIGPDLIHSNGIKTHCLAWVASPKTVPLLWHVHDFLSARPLARQLLRLAARRIAGAIAISQAVANDVKAMGIDKPIRVIPNAVDTREYVPHNGDGGILD
jgi:glycosyltransferase involved in cell wall biosynthesis